jgi:hypothetical protein
MKQLGPELFLATFQGGPPYLFDSAEKALQHETGLGLDSGDSIEDFMSELEAISDRPSLDQD